MTDSPKEPEDLKTLPPRFVGMHPELSTDYGKNHHAQRLSEEIREMRIALRKAAQDDPRIHQVFRQAEYCGLNGEDTYTMLAFHLHQAYAHFRAALATEMQRQFRGDNPEIAKFFADKTDTNDRG